MWWKYSIWGNGAYLTVARARRQGDHLWDRSWKSSMHPASTVTNILVYRPSQTHFLPQWKKKTSFSFSQTLTALHNVFHSCLSAAVVWVILYDEESAREEGGGGWVRDSGKRWGSKSWGPPPPLALDSFTPVVESLLCTHGNICACKRTRKRLCIEFLPAPCSGLCSGMIRAAGWWEP